MEPLQKRMAGRVKALLDAVDPRLLVFLCSMLGVLSWLAPYPWLGLLFPLALLAAFTVCSLKPSMRKAVAAYAGFAVFWSLGFLLMRLWEHPGEARAALYSGASFGLRLYCILGFGLAVPLSLTPLVIGRVFTWYARAAGRAEVFFLSVTPLRGRVRPRVIENAWRCGLALAVMVAFLPRSFCVLSGLRLSLALRAPHLPLRRRLFLLALAALRLLSTQTWDMTMAIASRDLYRAQPWEWRK